MKVLLDSNILIDIVRFKLDVDEIDNLISKPYTLVTVDSVINELTGISNRKSKVGGYAKVALKIVRRYNFEVLKAGRKQTDKALLDLAKSEKILVATNDRMLRKELKALDKKTIYLKSKKHLALG